MGARQPRPFMLPGEITLWNCTGVEGGERRYQPTRIKHVSLRTKLEERSHKSGKQSGDVLEIGIYKVSLATGEDGEQRRYVPSELFSEMDDETKRSYFTLDPGRDFVGLGTQRDRAVVSVRAVSEPGGEMGDVHHWEVVCR